MIASSDMFILRMFFLVFGRWASCCYPGHIIDISKTNMQSDIK